MASFFVEFGGGFLHKSLIVNDKALVQTFADQAAGIKGFYFKYQTLAVDFNQLGFATCFTLSSVPTVP